MHPRFMGCICLIFLFYILLNYLYVPEATDSLLIIYQHIRLEILYSQIQYLKTSTITPVLRYSKLLS